MSSVAVVGAGISGVTCARLLSGRFDTVHIFDYGDTRIRTGHFGKLNYEIGAMVIGTGQRYMSKLLFHDLKLETQSVVRRIQTVRFFFKGRLLSADEIAKDSGLDDINYDDMVASYFQKLIEAHLETYDLDKISAREFFAQNMPIQAVDLFEHDLFGTLVSPGLGHICASQVVEYVMRNLEMLENPDFVKIKDGNEQIIEKYKELVKKECLNVTWHNSKVTKVIKYDDESCDVFSDIFKDGLKVNRVIICTPLTSLPELEPAIKVPPVPYHPHMRIYLHLRSRFWGANGYVISDDPEIQWVEDHTFLQDSEDGILELHLCGAEATKLGEAGKTKDELADEACRRISRIWPEIMEEGMLLGSDSYYWPSAIPYFPPGTRKQYLEDFHNLDFTLCGDYLGHQAGNLNGAMEAATSVCDRLLRTYCKRAPSTRLDVGIKPFVCGDMDPSPTYVDRSP